MSQNRLESFPLGTLVTLTPIQGHDPVSGVIALHTDDDLKVIYSVGDQLRYARANAELTPDVLLGSLDVTEHADTPLRPALKELVNHLQAVANEPPINRGQVVRFDMDDESHTGRVLEVGEDFMIRVAYSEALDVTLPRHGVALVKLPTPDTTLKDWTVANQRERDTDNPESMQLETLVSYRGQPVFGVTNTPSQPSLVEVVDGAPEQATFENLQVALAEYQLEHWLPPMPSTQLWLTWACYGWTEQPKGISFAEFVNAMTNNHTDGQ